MTMIFLYLIMFQFKHYLADYLLQGKYMLGKFKYKGWQLPLAAHCGVHLMFTTFIAMSGVSVGIAIMLGLMDFIIHFVMDRVKASPNLMGKHKALSHIEMMLLTSKEPTTIHMNSNGQGYMRINVPQSEIDAKLESNVKFWHSLGFDQMVHHLTDILIVFIIVSNLG